MNRNIPSNVHNELYQIKNHPVLSNNSRQYRIDNHVPHARYGSKTKAYNILQNLPYDYRRQTIIQATR